MTHHELLIHLVAHRGDARDYPENTLPAFSAALAHGLQFLELDVHLSADGVPMVIHDHDLMRTTGRSGCVFDLRAAELAQIDAAEPARFGDRFRGTRIPQLTEVLALLEHRPDVTLFVEIKRASLTRFGYDQVLSRIAGVLKPARRQCVVISFDLAAVQRVRPMGNLAIGWVLSAYDAQARLKCDALRPEWLFVDHEMLPAGDAPLWRGPWRWAVYEVETVTLAQALAARGGHYIETMAVREMSTALRDLSTAPPIPDTGAGMGVGTDVAAGLGTARPDA